MDTRHCQAHLIKFFIQEDFPSQANVTCCLQLQILLSLSCDSGDLDGVSVVRKLTFLLMKVHPGSQERDCWTHRVLAQLMSRACH